MYEDPFVLPVHVQQVFYVNDTKLGNNLQVVQRVKHRHLWDLLVDVAKEDDVRRSSSQTPMQQLESEGVTEVSDDDVVAGLVREDLEPDEIDMQEFLKLRQENNSVVDEEEEYDDEKHAELEEREKLDHFLDEMTWVILMNWTAVRKRPWTQMIVKKTIMRNQNEEEDANMKMQHISAGHFVSEFPLTFEYIFSLNGIEKIQNSSSHSATTARRRTTPTIAGHEALAPDITETLEVVESDASASKITSTQAPNINVPPARNIIITPGLNVNVTTAPNANAAPKGSSWCCSGESSEKLVQKYGKLKILFLPGEAVLVDKDEQLSSAIGVIVKGHADIGKAIVGWEWLLAKTFAMLGLHLFDIEDQGTPRVQQIIDNKFQVAYTRWRYVLHAAHKSLEAKGISPRSLSPRTYITLEKWKLACDFIEDEKYQKRSSINIEN
ncbi:hypothetical protein OROHE_000088 [Orobanche hederae]